MTERLHFHFSLSCTGEGNSNPLQCSCLENPRDGGAWWAAVYGIAQSRTRLKWLSSSSSSSKQWKDISCLRIRRLSIKMEIFPKLIYKFSTISIKTLTDPKFILPQNSPNNFKKKNRVGRLNVSNFRFNCKATVIQIMWCWYRVEIQINGLELRVQKID